MQAHTGEEGREGGRGRREADGGKGRKLEVGWEEMVREGRGKKR